MDEPTAYPTAKVDYERGREEKADLPSRPAVVTEAVQRLHRTIDHSHELITALYDRTRVVRVEGADELIDKSSAMVRESVATSPLTDEVQVAIAKQQHLNERITGLLESIEV